MQRTKLGEQYVRFTVDGLKESEAAVGKTAAKNELTWGNMARNIAGKMRTAMAGAFAIAAPAAGLLGFAKAASQGTREGNDMALSMQYLTNVIGSMFAPAMRVAATIVVRVADAIHRLSPETKGWIVAISLASAGMLALGGAAAIASVAFTGLAAVAGIAWAVITSPIGVVALGILGLIRLVMSLADMFSIGSRGIKDTMLGNNRTWIDAMVSGIKVVAKAGAQFFNWWARQSAKISDWIAEAATTLLEAAGIVDEGTTKLLREMPKTKPIQIDIAGIEADLDAIGRRANAVLPNFAAIEFKARGIGKELQKLPGIFGKLFGAGGEMRFNASLDVKFESLQGTFDRLQEAFAKGNQADDLKRIRDNGNKANDVLGEIRDLLKRGAAIIGN